MNEEGRRAKSKEWKTTKIVIAIHLSNFKGTEIKWYCQMSYNLNINQIALSTFHFIFLHKEK